MATNKELEIENAELKTGIEALTEELQELATDEYTTLKEENTAMKEKIADLQSQVKDQPVTHPVIAGFMLSVGDPFGAGALRAYLSATKQKQVQPPVIPFVLPDNDVAAQTALKSYILRSGGAGDTDRAAAARKVLDRLCPGWDVKKKPATAKAK